MENQRLDIEQKRAKFAFDHKTSSQSTNYDAMVKKVPAYIQTNGFIYTMAFLTEKDKGVFETIWKWHCDSSTENLMCLESLKDVPCNKFLKTLISLKTPKGIILTDEDIRLVTLETLNLFTWLRRFVKDED